MGQITSRKLASSKDPMFEINPQNVAKEITKDNWEDKATIRIKPDGDWIYLWVDEAEVTGKGIRYQACAKAKDQSRETMGNFEELDEALNHANTRKGKYEEARIPENKKELPLKKRKHIQIFFPNVDLES